MEPKILRKKNIVVNFLKQEKFAISKSNQGFKELTRELAKFMRSARFAARFKDIKKDSIRANQDCIYLNSEFEPINTKFEK